LRDSIRSCDVTMRPSFRVLFLIVTGSVALHISTLTTFIMLVGYVAFERFDWWLARREREKKFDEIIFNWEPSKEEPESEEQGGISRIRLTGQNQIITARIADLLRGM
jgi:hypothetical protein